ncbi:MAG: C40 family peptidase, partial [Psychrosphaera sp.]|nr:C40 family peptidase [Psychrosphaera sp.]
LSALGNPFGHQQVVPYRWQQPMQAHGAKPKHSEYTLSVNTEDSALATFVTLNRGNKLGINFYRNDPNGQWLDKNGKPVFFGLSASDIWIYKNKAGFIENYNHHGRIILLSNRADNQQIFQYKAAKLSKVLRKTGPVWHVTYDADAKGDAANRIEEKLWREAYLGGRTLSVGDGGNGGVTGQQIIAAGVGWLDVPYSPTGGSTKAGVDCSHYVHNIFNEVGLNYSFSSTGTFANNSAFYQVAIPKTGDVVLFDGHIGIYNATPPINGWVILSATTTKGVRYGPVTWFTWFTGFATRRYFRHVDFEP